MKGLILVRVGELNTWVRLAASFKRFLFAIRSEGTWFNLSSAQFEPLSVNDIISECRWWHLLAVVFYTSLDPEENSIEQRCLSFGKVSFFSYLFDWESISSGSDERVSSILQCHTVKLFIKLSFIIGEVKK